MVWLWFFAGIGSLVALILIVLAICTVLNYVHDNSQSFKDYNRWLHSTPNENDAQHLVDWHIRYGGKQNFCFSVEGPLTRATCRRALEILGQKHREDLLAIRKCVDCNDIRGALESRLPVGVWE